MGNYRAATPDAPLPFEHRGAPNPKLYYVIETGYGTPCWYWNGELDAWGYALFSLNRKIGTRRVHQFYYELLKGRIPDGLHLHHMCREKACVNPEHLEPITPKEHRARHPHSTRKRY